jgi:hypothetical protein
MSGTFVSDYARLSNSGRVLISLIGTVSANGAQVFVQNRGGELLTTLKLENAEEAELEVASLSEQLDKWEAHQREREEAAATRRSNRR